MKRKTNEKINITAKVLVVYVLFVLVLIGLFGRVTYLKVVKGQEYEIAARFQHTSETSKTINPNRGSILDRNGQIMAFSDTVYYIILDANVLMKNTLEEQERTVTELSEILGIEQETLRKALLPKEDGKYSMYNRVAKQVPRKIKKEIDDRNLKGVWPEADSKRSYPFNSLASYITGFMGGEKGYWGIEQQYNEYLMGAPGRTFVTYQDKNNKVTNVIEPKTGDTVISTIDTNIQQFAEQAVKNAMEASNPKNASILVMNPNTGELLAMASSPGFDLNNPYDLDLAGFDSSIMSKQEQSDALNKLWRNYNISDTYEPGSTFKPMVVATALEEDIISINDTFYCSGSKQVVEGEKPIGCWRTSGHGTQTLDQALANSCNVAMMEIGAKMGKETFYEYQRAFGFGERTGIDLPGEPSNSSFANLLHNLENINKAELATMSFGQTFNCTPLQLLNAFNAIINGGNLMKPYTVSQIIDIDNRIILQNEPIVERKIISKEVSDIVRGYLKSAVDSGTGRKLAIEGYTIGGKTGTAQQGERKKILSDNEFVISFVAFLPVENPQIVAMSILDRPQEGDKASAAPMLKEFLEKTIEYFNIEPTEPIGNNVGASKDIVMDDYSKVSLIEATSSISMLNLNFEILGTGSIITNQFPAPGTPVKEGTKVMLYLTNSEGGKKTTVPDLIGKTYEETVTILGDLGIVPVIEGDQEGLVVLQEPKMNSNIDVGGSIRIKFQK